jgi:hypothetical protein
MGRETISELCETCDLGKKCPKAEDLTIYYLEGAFKK